MYDADKEMCRAVGVKKPQEAQKGKALWKVMAAKDAGEEYYDSTREDNIQGRSETRLALWEEHLKDPNVSCPWFLGRKEKGLPKESNVGG